MLVVQDINSELKFNMHSKIHYKVLKNMLLDDKVFYDSNGWMMLRIFSYDATNARMF